VEDATTLSWSSAAVSEWVWRQEAQLSHRGRALFRVIRYFAKPLKVTQGHSKWLL